MSHVALSLLLLLLLLLLLQPACASLAQAAASRLCLPAHEQRCAGVCPIQNKQRHHS
jgi:hypothetical protein